jgi:hypothetical protein
MRGIPNWDLTDGWFFQRFNSAKYPSFANQFEADLHVEREFKGTGPTLTWEAAQRLLGDDNTGRLNVDWSLTGGVLFGKQKTRLTGVESDGQFEGSYNYSMPRPLVLETNVVDRERKTSISAPVLDLSLGLSYEIQRIRIGAGYRWERYFDVLDAGADEHENYDRTIDGPYLKIAVGFGG